MAGNAGRTVQNCTVLDALTGQDDPRVWQIGMTVDGCYTLPPLRRFTRSCQVQEGPGGPPGPPCVHHPAVMPTSPARAKGCSGAILGMARNTRVSAEVVKPQRIPGKRAKPRAFRTKRAGFPRVTQ